MEDEKIKLRVTESGRLIEVLVLNKHADRIDVLLGTGADSVRCRLLLTPSGRAYAGSIMGREIVYERGRREVQGDLERSRQSRRQSRRS